MSKNRKFKRSSKKQADDLLEKIYDEARKDVLREIAASFGHDIEECGRVAAEFPPERRKWGEAVPWGAYVAVLGMPASDQDTLLEYHAQHGQFPDGFFKRAD